MKPLLFRFQTGGLNESMNTVITITGLDVLIGNIKTKWKIPFSSIVIQPYMFDERIGWDTHLVMISIDCDKTTITYPVGYLNRKPDWQDEERIIL